VNLNHQHLKKQNYVGSETTPYIDKGYGDTLARGVVSLLCQGKGRPGEDLEVDMPSPQGRVLQTKTLKATEIFNSASSFKLLYTRRGSGCETKMMGQLGTLKQSTNSMSGTGGSYSSQL